MGDKSPKSKQKNSSQKKQKTDANDQKKARDISKKQQVHGMPGKKK